MDSKLEQFTLKYQQGQALLDKGQYRSSVKILEEAKSLISLSSRLGGDVQLSLVTAYQGINKLDDAIAICEELTRHPNLEIRQQSQRILYILKAPQLKRPEEWMTKIPTTNTDDNSTPRYIQAKPVTKSFQKPSLNLEDVSKIDTKDNGFIGLALVLFIFIIGGLIWLGKG
ncbi:tetratricopeptide repeat protein [Crocosphaera sp. Alani8]|uniref:tetratricopeptide repeat protein n=1 Tax=Crocosphaera sp. Alani8 TaxID=3038952 RepID=UPI00313BE034